MSKNIFFISDTHFGQQSILGFKRADGTPLRPFESLEEMHETFVDNWNTVVRPQDKVYHCGDVASERCKPIILEIFGRLNGRKILIRGNHDKFKPKYYLDWFYDIRGVGYVGDFVLTHVPVHPNCLNHHSNRVHPNIHGHLHYQRVLLPDGTEDNRYFNVSVENIDYTPIAYETLRKIFEERNR
jgi:calcineurin-like phosphoesterase family protein